MSFLMKKYIEDVKPALQKKFGYKNLMSIPKLDKVVISMGLADVSKDKNALEDSLKELALISGQKAVLTKAKKSVSNFKLREGQPIGAKVTLRKKRMMDFLYRFCNIVSPRIRDFRGFALKCDGKGNYNVGLDDQQVFFELNLDDVKRVQGMNISFITSAKTDEECVELLKQLGFPFKKQD